MNRKKNYRMTMVWMVLVVGSIFFHGCATPTRHKALPVALQTQAEIPGLPDVCYRVGCDDADLVREGILSNKRELDYLFAAGHEGPMPPAIILAISGGGDNGAFGAGLLNGWTEAGGRPEFKVVSGISTGALIAPFAFLGPEYDHTLKEVYTNISGKDILKKRDLKVYIIRNSRLDAQWSQVERRTMSIAERAISSLIQTQGIGDLLRIYLIAKRDRADFNLAFIPPSFNVSRKEQFDTEYMRQLFAVGYEMAVKGYPWRKTPPGFYPGK